MPAEPSSQTGTAARAAQTGERRDFIQAGSITAALLAALVGTDLLDLRGRSTVVADVDRLALALWVASLVFLVLLSATTGSRRLTLAAIACTAAAGVLTVAAVVAVLSGISEDRDRVRLALAADAEAAVMKLCANGRPLQLDGSVATGNLADEFVVFTFARDAGTSCDQIRIPRASILGIREHPPSGRSAAGAP